MTDPASPRRRVWVSWSSGKDSTCALHLLHRDATVDVVGLLYCDVLSAREGPPRDRLGFDGTDRGGLLVRSLVFDLLTDLRHEGGHRDRQAVEHLIADGGAADRGGSGTRFRCGQ